MGMFSFIEKGLGLRTGATQAAKKAKESGEEYLAQQQAFQDKLMGLYQPSMDTGDAALQNLSDYYSGDQQAYYDQAMSSPAYMNLVSQGEDAIARNQQAFGGFRSGTTGQNLAQNSQNVLQGLVNQNLQGQQYLANYGGDARNAYSNASAGILNQIGGTMGQNAQIGVNQAANKQNLLSGIVNLGVQAGSAAFSDERLKDNVTFNGIENGYNTYSWEWNEKANKLGLYGESKGVIAQEVEKVTPEAIAYDGEYMKVNYELIGVSYGV